MMAYLIFQCLSDSANLTYTSSRLRLSCSSIKQAISRSRSIFVLAPFSYISFVLISYTLASMNSACWLFPLEYEFQCRLNGCSGNVLALHRHLYQTFIPKESFMDALQSHHRR